MTRIAILLIIFSFCLAPARVQAQLCDIIPETITHYKKQSFGNYNLWDASYGEPEDIESMHFGFGLNPKYMIMVGTVKDQRDVIRSLTISKIDRRGRKTDIKTHSIDGLQSVARVLHDDDIFWVLGDVQSKSGKQHVWLGRFDLNGDLLGEKTIREASYHVRAGDIVMAYDAANYKNLRYVVGVNIQKFIEEQSDDKRRKMQDREMHQSRLYFVDKAIKTIGKRTYALGVNNKIFDIEPLENNEYAIVGQMKAANNRQSGWLLVLTRDGGIKWQREFSRGGFSRLNAASAFLNNHIILGGVVESVHKNTPAARRDSGVHIADAGWTMAVSISSGDIVWERYFTGEYDYAVKDIMATGDGVIHALIASGGLDVLTMSDTDLKMQITDNASPNYQHAVMITVSPHGNILNKSSYFDGVGVQPSSMMVFNRKFPTIFGQTISPTILEGDEGEDSETIYSPDGWAMMAAALKPYNDPCQ